MAYTAAQYAAQERLMVRPLADWPDGVRRATCASRDCHARWLNIRPPAPSTPAPAVGVDSHAAAPTHDGFAVGLVIGLID